MTIYVTFSSTSALASMGTRLLEISFIFKRLELKEIIWYDYEYYFHQYPSFLCNFNENTFIDSDMRNVLEFLEIHERERH